MQIMHTVCVMSVVVLLYEDIIKTIKKSEMSKG